MVFLFFETQSRTMKPSSFDDIDPGAELERLPKIKNMSKAARPARRNARAHLAAPIIVEAGLDDEMETAAFSYQPSRYERGWLLESLSGFYDMHWFSDVIRMIKGGKEASVYLCSAPQNNVSLLAAKVYRPRRFRNLRNDHLYREGRTDLDGSGRIIHDDRMLRAMQKRTGFGRELLHTSWIEYEYQTLQRLHQAGCDVPCPYARGQNAILMQYIGDEQRSAPTLSEISLPRTEAEKLFERVLHNLDQMLSHNCIHGDLSAFNILYWEGQITLIDFPQTIAPNQNPSAHAIFRRDVTRICEYFSAQGVRVPQPGALSARLWQQHNQQLTPAIHPADLDPENEDDVRFWKAHAAR